jgi:uncharacterized membrane-anchored protein
MKLANKLSQCTALAVMSFGFASLAFAQEPEATPAAEAAEPQVPQLTYQTGEIVLPNKVATLHLSDKYRYLDPQETSKLLVAWGNPPDADTQGAVIPADVDPFTDRGWAVIVTYEEEGHIDDADAAELDYDDMLKDMKEGTESNNSAREEAGYGSVHLMGWAEKPHYDAAAKKLYWAKELKFEGSDQNSLNYDVRVLGREGVLSMNAISGIDQLEQVRSDMKPLIEVAEFNQGYRYAEYNKSTDKAAAYGLGALIAGGVAAKTGLLAKIGIFLLAKIKFVIAGVVALGAGLAKLFGKKKADDAV